MGARVCSFAELCDRLGGPYNSGKVALVCAVLISFRPVATEAWPC